VPRWPRCSAEGLQPAACRRSLAGAHPPHDDPGRACRRRPGVARRAERLVAGEVHEPLQQACRGFSRAPSGLPNGGRGPVLRNGTGTHVCPTPPPDPQRGESAPQPRRAGAEPGRPALITANQAIGRCTTAESPEINFAPRPAPRAVGPIADPHRLNGGGEAVQPTTLKIVRRTPPRSRRGSRTGVAVVLPHFLLEDHVQARRGCSSGPRVPRVRARRGPARRA